jgi:DtxR family transcriptional regulator, Mn-dependent transcriptional regulator
VNLGVLILKIQESAENYLETILILHRRNGMVRSIDIVNELNYAKPSISVAMKHFKENDLITVDENGYISLTKAGRDIAEKMYERHTFLTEVLVQLGVDEEIAKVDACKIEHHISDEAFEMIKQHSAKRRG